MAKPNFRTSVLLPMSLLITLVVLGGCVTLNQLDQAQDSFNKGAELENLSTFTSESFTNLSPDAYYNLAYSKVKAALKKEAQLMSDTLLGNAYTIKALCEWKLKRYNQARASSVKALRQFQIYEAAGIYMHRDKAVMRALGGLIEIDQVNDTLYQHFSSQAVDPMEAKTFFTQFVHDLKEEKVSNIESALQTIEKAKNGVRPTHQVQVYFILCQLSALKVWSDGFNFLKNSLDTAEDLSTEERKNLRDFIFAERDAYKMKKEKYLQSLASKLPRGESNRIYRFWSELL